MHILLWIVCSLFFCASAHAEKSIAIFTYKVAAAKPWDPESVKSGITGSEEAVIYMSQKLARLGYRVVVLGSPPANSSHSRLDSNPRFVDLDQDDGAHYDIAISWRMPFAAERLRKRADAVYLWPHDTYDGRLTIPEIYAFDDVLWLSNWQREYWMNVNPEFARFTKLFGNGINPEQFGTVQKRQNPYSCIYGSNYGRGLEILLNIWPEVKKQFPQATLDIYYGWQHWGLLTPEQEAKMRGQVAASAPLGVEEHGLVSHEELNRAYEKASFWTYPCYCPEIFPITSIKAQYAGCIPVIIQGSGLKETVPHGFWCQRSDEYLATLLASLQQAETIDLKDREKMREFVLKDFTWEAVAHKWQRLFESHQTLNLPEQDKTVMIAILARNKAHVLPHFLKDIENFDYNKKLITIYVNTNNNEDNTKEILEAWAKKNEPRYAKIVIEDHTVSELQAIRNKSLQKAKEYKCDYYFTADCDTFLDPSTLKLLVSKNKPIIAPLLRAIPEKGDIFSNYFCDVVESGYYKDHPNYMKIFNREMVGTFKVPLVHHAYLINSAYIDKLNYIDGSDQHEFIIFARSARNNNVDQYICNEIEFGTNVHFHSDLSLEEERNRLQEFFNSH